MAIVILPAYQPDETLVGIVNRLWETGSRNIVVDDGSGAEYRHIFDSIGDICTVLRHPENKGKGAAIKTALAYIKKEIGGREAVGVMDADGQHLTEDMWRLLDAAVSHKNTLVLGVRHMGKEMPLKSRWGNKITRTVFRLASGVKVSDTQTGLRAFGTELIPRLLAVEGERYEYETNVLLALTREGIAMEEVPIHTIYHDRENSCSHFRAFRDSLRIYKDILKFSLASLSAFALDYLAFAMFMAFLPRTAGWILAANVSARVISAFYNYSVNSLLVFRTGRKVRTAAGYFALAAVILLMNNLILQVFTQVFGLSVYPAKLLTEFALFVFSWLVQRFVIFRRL